MDDTVLAKCGLTFRPQPQLFGDGLAVLAPPWTRRGAAPVRDRREGYPPR